MKRAITMMHEHEQGHDIIIKAIQSLSTQPSTEHIPSHLDGITSPPASTIKEVVGKYRKYLEWEFDKKFDDIRHGIIRYWGD
jgi:hypothetical protein